MSASLMIFLLAASLSTGGALTVETEPGAQVVWEGVILGRADERGRMEIEDIPPGAYSLTVSKNGFSSLNKRIEIHVGSQAARFSLTPLSKAGLAERSRAELKLPPPVRVGLSSVEAAPAAEPKAGDDFPSNYAGDADAEEVRKSSQIQQSQSSGAPPIWYILVGAVMAGVLYRFLRRPLKMAPSREAEQPAFSGPDLGGADSAETPTGTTSAAFLDDLRRREAMAENGIVALSRDDEEGAIELDKTAVRIVEE